MWWPQEKKDEIKTEIESLQSEKDAIEKVRRRLALRGNLNAEHSRYFAESERYLSEKIHRLYLFRENQWKGLLIAISLLIAFVLLLIAVKNIFD